MNWQQQANCKRVDIEIFFKTGEKGVKRAKTFCRFCHVRERCLQYALKTEGTVDENGNKMYYPYGIYGGYTPEERKALV